MDFSPRRLSDSLWQYRTRDGSLDRKLRADLQNSTRLRRGSILGGTPPTRQVEAVRKVGAARLLSSSPKKRRPPDFDDLWHRSLAVSTFGTCPSPNMHPHTTPAS